MIDFRLDEEQKMLTDAIARYSREMVRPVHRDAEENRAIPSAVVEAGWEMGVLPSGIPEEYGGFGEYSAVTGAVATEAFAWGDLAVTMSLMTPNLVAVPLMLSGTEAQKKRYLPAFCEERMPDMTAAITEPRIQFSPYTLQTTAVFKNGLYYLNGEKTMVPLADLAQTILVYASEGSKTEAFLVPADTVGLTIGERDKLMGVQALPTFKVSLNDCVIPAANKLGGGDGIDFDKIMSHSRVALGAAAVGMARAGFEYARDYAKERVQFDEPIAHRQSIAFMLAEMATDVDEARLMVWEAAWKLDRGEDAVRETAVLKRHIDEMVVRNADRALQILGGYGYIREYPVELWLRNARGFATFDGLAII